MCVGDTVHGLIKYSRKSYQNMIILIAVLYAVVIISICVVGQIYYRRLPTLEQAQANLKKDFSATRGPRRRNMANFPFDLSKIPVHAAK